MDDDLTDLTEPIDSNATPNPDDMTNAEPGVAFASSVGARHWMTI